MSTLTSLSQSGCVNPFVLFDDAKVITFFYPCKSFAKFLVYINAYS